MSTSVQPDINIIKPAQETKEMMDRFYTPVGISLIQGVKPAGRRFWRALAQYHHLREKCDLAKKSGDASKLTKKEEYWLHWYEVFFGPIIKTAGAGSKNGTYLSDPPVSLFQKVNLSQTNALQTPLAKQKSSSAGPTGDGS